jgi:prefoldin alpha subunit
MNEQLQHKYMEFQMLQQQLQQVAQQMHALDSQANEMDLVEQALEDFSKSKEESEAFVTLTPGLFVKAKITNTEKVLLNVGSGAVVEKTIPAAKEVIKEQGTELRKLKEELNEQMAKLNEHAEKLQGELQSLVK